ncbi:MAG: hypothetical protein ACRC42_03545 [Mycoplasma sp.]
MQDLKFVHMTREGNPREEKSIEAKAEEFLANIPEEKTPINPLNVNVNSESLLEKYENIFMQDDIFKNTVARNHNNKPKTNDQREILQANLNHLNEVNITPIEIKKEPTNVEETIKEISSTLNLQSQPEPKLLKLYDQLFKFLSDYITDNEPTDIDFDNLNKNEIEKIYEGLLIRETELKDFTEILEKWAIEFGMRKKSNEPRVYKTLNIGKINNKNL